MNRSVIDAEKLAALLDGRLSEAERVETLARLAKSPEELALLADVDAVVRAESVAATQPIIPISAARSARRPLRLPQSGWIALAAGIAAAAAFMVLPRRHSEWQARGLPPDMDFAMWGVARGATPPPPSSDSARSWRIGALQSDLSAAIASGDGTRASRFASGIAALLADSRMSVAASYYRRIADSSTAGASRLESLARDGRQATETLLDPALLRLAAWTEKARIAAHQHDASLFKIWETTRALAELRAWNASLATDVERHIAAANWVVLEATLAALLQNGR